ncbi:manganese-binding transcriptional regulator MntR [Alienimonas sp. DA493]|uniref:manganese-binding transcriptional regulator MntR n=1 Tax=Alienimonas sp. DA493 TaxID=3373605 RepID=UPI003754CE74
MSERPAPAPPRPPGAAPHRHRRTRKDHATEVAEDYVEAIAELISKRGECRVSHLAERFSVSHVTVTRTVGRLVRDGLAETTPRAPITLTPAGAELAAACRDRHAAVLRFLLALGVPEAVAQVDAEGIEHHVSPETLAAMRGFTAAKPDA